MHQAARFPCTTLRVAALAMLATGCWQDPAPREQGNARVAAPSNAAVAPATGALHGEAGTAGTARISRYTELSGCPVVAQNIEEAGYRVLECEGPGGFAVRLVTADARDNLMIKPADGDFASLRMPGLVNGAFSTVRPRVEWRGTRDAAFVPDAQVVRYMAAENPDDPAEEAAYLVVVRLTAPGACVAALLPPSPTQSDDARKRADSAPGCM